MQKGTETKRQVRKQKLTEHELRGSEINEKNAMITERRCAQKEKYKELNAVVNTSRLSYNDALKQMLNHC